MHEFEASYKRITYATIASGNDQQFGNLIRAYIRGKNAFAPEESKQVFIKFKEAIYSILQ